MSRPIPTPLPPRVDRQRGHRIVERSAEVRRVDEPASAWVQLGYEAVSFAEERLRFSATESRGPSTPLVCGLISILDWEIGGDRFAADVGISGAINGDCGATVVQRFAKSLRARAPISRMLSL